jgi:uncharacterized protein
MTPATSARPFDDAAPWWRHAMVWLVIAFPAAAVVAGVATLIIAIVHPDPPLATRAAGAATSAQPAVQARNHAATPHRP